MSRIDVVVDLETLGVGINPVITQVGMVAFNIDTGKVIARYRNEISITSSLDHGFVIDADTLRWWMNQDDLLTAKVMNGTKHVDTIVDEITKWLEAVVVTARTTNAGLYFWGNGILADNVWLKSAYKAVGRTYPIKYTNDRDVRTLLELAAKRIDQPTSAITNEIDFKGNKHDALDDAMWEAELISKCWNLISS